MSSSLIADVRDGRRLPPPKMAKAIRVSAGITQSQLAAELGVHRVTIARWEAGDLSPRGAVRARYARLINELQSELAS